MLSLLKGLILGLLILIVMGTNALSFSICNNDRGAFAMLMCITLVYFGFAGWWFCKGTDYEF